MNQKELSVKEIALFSLYLLGGWKKRIHTEDIALKCFKLAPTKFSWTKYPRYPDLAPARFALEGAKKESSGALVEGESEKKKNTTNIGGWRLTKVGVKWIKENLERIELTLGKHKQIGSRLEISRNIKALTSSKAFNKFLNNTQETITFPEFCESLICTVNTDKKVLNERIEQIRASSEKLNRNDINSFLDLCCKSFSKYLT